MKWRTAFKVRAQLLLTGIVAVAVLWSVFNRTRLFEGRLLFILWSGHGIHVLDLVLLGVEVVLLFTLTRVLLSRPSGDF